MRKRGAVLVAESEADVLSGQMVAVSTMTIPMAPGPPIIGNMRQMVTATGDFLTRQYLRLGPVFRVRALNRRLLVLAGPEANALMKRQGHRLFASGEVMQDIHQVLGGDNPTVIELDGPDHRTLRAGLKEGYSGRTLYAQMEKLVRSQFSLLRSWPVRTPIAAFPHVKRLVSSVLGLMATNQEPAEVMEDLIYFFRALVQIHIQRVRPSSMKYLPRYAAAKRSVHAMARRIWDQHHVRDYLESGGDFVDLVRKFHAEHPRLMNERDAVAALIGPFIAGMDTAASATSFLLYHILRDPELRRAVVAEADLAFAAGFPDRESLRSMVHTRHAAMEILRLHPPAPALPRTSIAAFEFQGYEIPKDEYCIIANTVTHHLPQYFPDPERFDVGRYAADRKEHLQPNVYCPYGLGPHTCLGASVADLLYLVVTAVLFRHFHVEMQPPDQALHVAMNPLPSPDDRFRIAITGTRYPLPQRPGPGPPS